MSRAILLVVLVLALIGAGVAVFLKTHEQRETSVPVDPLDEAWIDEYLAATRLLQKLHIDSREVMGLEGDYKPAAHAVLVIQAPRGALSDAAVERVTDAVSLGARLIIESESVGSQDPLLDNLEVERKRPENKTCRYGDSNAYEEWEFRPWKKRLKSESPKAPVMLDVDVLGEPALKASVMGGESLSIDANTDWEIKGCDGVRVLHFAQGDGSVTVVNDLRFAKNWFIGRDDNAEFFSRLVQIDGKPDEVIFFSGSSSGLKEWLRIHAWRVGIALGALIVFWLWSIVPRFGPLRADPEPQRRRLLDHLRANGRLLWSGGARAELGRAARDWAVARVAHEHPHIRALTAEEFVAFLERRFRLPHAWALLFLPTASHAEVPRLVALARACRALHVQLRKTPATQHDPLYDPASDSHE